MKVWIVMRGDWEADDIAGVFDCEHCANAERDRYEAEDTADPKHGWYRRGAGSTKHRRARLITPCHRD